MYDLNVLNFDIQSHKVFKKLPSIRDQILSKVNRNYKHNFCFEKKQCISLKIYQLKKYQEGSIKI